MRKELDGKSIALFCACDRKTTMYKLSPILRNLKACEPALAWVKQNNYATFAEAWAACPRADWMLWLIAHTMPREVLVECACDIAETALAYVPAGEDRPRHCIDVTRRWARGDASIDEVREARRGAYAYAASAAYAYAAADAADADAAYAAAAYAASAAAYAAYAAAYAAYAYAAADATRARCRDAIRARVPAALIERALYDYAMAHGCAEVAS